MELSEAIRMRIYDLIRKRETNINKMCIRGGLPTSTVTSFLSNASRSLKVGTLLHICEGLDIQIRDFFNDPIFDDVMEEDEK